MTQSSARAARAGRAAGTERRRLRVLTAGVSTGVALVVAGGLLHTALALPGGTRGSVAAPGAGPRSGTATGSGTTAGPGAEPATGSAIGSATGSAVEAGDGSGSGAATGPGTTATSGGGTTTSTTTTTTIAGSALPVGDLPGWRQVFTDDFTTETTEGRWGSSPYASRWLAYDGFPDTHGVGRYSEHLLSASGGMLRMRWHTEDGTPLVTGLVPLVDGAWGGHVGGRYSVRFRADATPGYVAALLLWPDSNVWDEGEVDFAEGDLDATINAYHHCPGDAEADCGTANTRARFSDWHVATVEWTPEGVTYLLDGYVLQRAHEVPTAPMHLVLQGFVRPAWDRTRDAEVQVDWVSIWYPTGS